MDVYLMQQLLQNHSQWRDLNRIQLQNFSDEDCLKKFRLPKEVIRDITEHLRDDLSSPSDRNNPIPPETQVLVALRLLASGSFQGVTSDTIDISQSSTCRILSKFCVAFSRHYRHLLRWYTSDEEIYQARRKFFVKTGVKGLLGLIDGTLVRIKGVSGVDEPAYICRKNYPSINIQVVVGPDTEFRNAVVQFPGSCHDSFIFNNSGLKNQLEADPSKGFLFGDSGYALSSTLITPYSNPTTPQEVNFNKVHSTVRSQVERSIGRLKNRWRCLHSSGGALQYEPPKCCTIIFTCLLLENLCISLGLNDESFEEDDEEDDNNLPVGNFNNRNRLGAERRSEISESLFRN